MGNQNLSFVHGLDLLNPACFGALKLLYGDDFDSLVNGSVCAAFRG
ncbi:hypothetical protein SLEP1_g25670 [Rubroshorea leprosula]|uniref:Uncharacterized protein n=1 Tax=Rubroshorea leprosula TaxID=152421 RepID=A0AAV5JQX9_9ROSI|nr:hypothetical protein SLEP1_g25670 [Rubroshorea leprosula]